MNPGVWPSMNPQEEDVMGRMVGILGLVMGLVGCAETTPFTVVVANVTAGPVTLQGAPEREGLVLLEGEGEAWDSLGLEEGCLRICGGLSKECLEEVDEEGAFVLMPGDEVEVEFDGVDWIPGVDDHGSCHRRETLRGALVAAVAFGLGARDAGGTELDLEGEDSGWSGNAVFAETHLVEVPFDLPDETWIEVELTP